MLDLSLCLIVRDEAAMLPRCLASVAGLVSEIVAVDTGSVDDTPSILAAAGAVVHAMDWADDFAAARNAALALVTRPWVLVLDADEALEEHRPGALADLLTPGAAPRSLALPVLNYIADSGADGAVRRSFAVRLFNRPDLHRWEGCLHEQLQGSAAEICPDGSLVIHHWGYQPALVRSRGKEERNRRLMAQGERAMTPIAYEVSLCRSAARPELIRRHAGEILRLSRDMGHGGIPVHVAVTRLAALRAQARDWQGLLAELGAAAEKWPFLENQGEVWYWLGRAFAGIGDEASALAALQSAWGLLHAADVPQFFEEADLPGRVCMAMAEVHWAASRPELALDAAQRAMGQTAVGASLQTQWQEVVSGWRQALESA